MSRNLRYNELDELDWEYKNGCYDHPEYDEWGEDAYIMDGSVPYGCTKLPDMELEPEDDETGSGIFGNELNHAQNAKNEPSGVVSNGQIFGHGEKDDIIRAIFDLMAPCRDYHFEFKFFEAK